MFKFNSLRAIAALTAALSAALPAAADELSETGDFIDGVAAIVNDSVVLKSQYDETLAGIIEQSREVGFQLPPADILQEQVLERVILTEIQLQRAALIGLIISDQDLNRIMENVALRQGITIAELPQALAAQGIDYQTFRRQMREDVTLQQLREIDVIRRIIVSDREIQNCIADLESNAVINSDYNLSHILLNLPESASATEIDEIVATAQSIYERASDGADFRELAARYSESETALQGGALGWMEGERVPTIFTEILTPLQSGEVSEPFRTRSSIHIVKVNDMRSALQRSEENQVLARHILIRPNQIIDDQTAQQRLQDAHERIQAGEDFGELAKLLSDDPGSANDGGELGWAGPGLFVPEFQAALDALETGVLSEPFRTPFGWHIAEVMERRVYDNTEDRKEQSCAERIRASKAEDETSLWLQRIRDEAYVDIRM